MGASGWSYFVPYQINIKIALEELHQRVFNDGDYYLRPPMDPNDYHPDAIPEDVWEEIELLLEKDKAFTKPTTIDELKQWNREDGTHSILDITEIAISPDFGVAAPLQSAQLLELFETEMPERSMVEKKTNEIQSLQGRWQGTYIIVYKGDIPDEIFFTGFSGD